LLPGCRRPRIVAVLEEALRRFRRGIEGIFATSDEVLIAHRLEKLFSDGLLDDDEVRRPHAGFLGEL
jgi:hypothetical protein